MTERNGDNQMTLDELPDADVIPLVLELVEKWEVVRPSGYAQARKHPSITDCYEASEKLFESLTKTRSPRQMAAWLRYLFATKAVHPCIQQVPSFEYLIPVVNKSTNDDRWLNAEADKLSKNVDLYVVARDEGFNAAVLWKLAHD